MDAKDKKHNRRRQWLGLFFWFLFAEGLLVQVVVPRLEISNGAFVIPQALTASGRGISPDELIRKERRTQLISAVLTICGALGLAFHYRDILMGRVSGRGDRAVEESAASDAERQRPSTNASAASDTKRGNE